MVLNQLVSCACSFWCITEVALQTVAMLRNGTNFSVEGHWGPLSSITCHLVSLLLGLTQ